MILSRTSQYALQALVYMATQPDGRPILNREIAAHLGAPPAYLAKILQVLRRGNLIGSTRGKLGGFWLREGAKDIRLIEVLRLTEGGGFTDPCMLGLKACGDDTACPVHCEWKPIKQEVADFLSEAGLKQLADDVRSGRYRLVDVPLALVLGNETPGDR